MSPRRLEGVAEFVSMVAYIFPSCTLLPFLIEPFATTFVPFWIGKALVRTRREVTIQDAEEFLQNPPYDLSRYGDILVNMMLCCLQGDGVAAKVVTCSFFHHLLSTYLQMLRVQSARKF